MQKTGRLPVVAQALVCWNWKCAGLSAMARSVVYLAAMARSGARGGLAVVLVEMVYVSLTAGLYAGLQQRALGFRLRWIGNLSVVLGVPALAQALDWVAHHAAGAVAPERATMAVSVFAGTSALFHLHVMRRGAFLSGRSITLLSDFRRMPRLLAEFVMRPFAILSALASRIPRASESEAAL